ncbi:MAG: radical SAM peptide maturase, CXXX-repeat target family [Clostridia bacterium]|nr:radical SAM peptide maturase, CXXX-repeat target family [Clostridia bacterium]
MTECLHAGDKVKPRNGLYLTTQDFPQWQDEFSKMVEPNFEAGKDNPDLRVKNITFVVTEDCNLNCTYCYMKRKTKRKMTRQTAKDAVDFILSDDQVSGYYDSKRSPAVTLEFIGGEPLLEITLVDYIVEYFKYRAFELGHPWAFNYMINVTTNGVLYFDERVQKFIKRNRDKLSLSITIDGDSKLHDSCRVFPNGEGSYNIVEKAVRHWMEIRPNYATKLTLAPENIMHLGDALKHMWDMGVRGAWTNCVFEEGWTISDARVLYSEMIRIADYLIDNNLYGQCFTSLFDESIGSVLTETRNWCGGNGQMLAIGTDGKCYPCIRFMNYSLSTDGRKEICIGNIYDGLDSPEHNCELCKLQKVDMITQSDEKCRSCKIASGCALCTAYNYDRFGDANHRATFICDMHHARVLANYYYWNKLYKKLKISKNYSLNISEDYLNEFIIRG